MASRPTSFLDNLFRLKLADLRWEEFERFFLDYLNSGIDLKFVEKGKIVLKRIKKAEMYAPGSGREQDGIDLRIELADGKVCALQCKKVKKWTVAQTKVAIKKAKAFPAQHYYLAVACDTDAKVQKEIGKHRNWTIWTLDTIRSDFRRLVPPAKRRDLLPFLSKEEIKRFLPFATSALVTPKKFFERYLGPDKPLRHDWRIIGRDAEIDCLETWARGDKKVAMLSARGGEGKTRIVREFCVRLEKAQPGTEILYLNPFREDDDFSLGLNVDAKRRFIVIDDAHRDEHVPGALMDMVRQDAHTRVILACRPQGKESILSLLLRIGIDPSKVEPMAVPTFKKAAAAELAKEVLGSALGLHLDEFIRLTDKNPFLITTAGALLREGRLQWGTWRTQPEFRQRVFEEFETENLNLAAVPAEEKQDARLLLRMLSVLSPIALSPELIEKAQRLIPGTATLEPLLNFLRLAELVVGPNQSLRVAPDLFADFLVYEACFDPSKKMPVWVKKLLGEFRDHGGVLIRNISEASWIAELNEVNDGSILAPLTEWQREEFLKQSFFGRQMILDKWKAFSHYLPEQTLKLAKLAIEEKSAPADSSPMANSSELNSYERLLIYIPALLKPVAKYHLKFSHEALDILWDLGRNLPPPQHNNQNHPWCVAAEAFKYADGKPKAYYDSALDWLEGLLKRPGVRSELVKPNPVLGLFLGPCFERTFDASYSEGRQIHIIEKHVSAQNSEELRIRVRKVLDSLIEEGSAILALDALSAAEVAIRRAGTMSNRGIKNANAYRKEWRPDRLKALALYKKVLRLYPGFEVRYTIRRELRRLVVYEEDPVFAKRLQKVLDAIVVDLELRTAIALTSDYSSEFESVAKQKDDPDRFNKMRDQWGKTVSEAARKIAKAFPTASKLHGFMLSILESLLNTGHGQNLNLYQLFASLGFLDHRLGSALAAKILAAKASPDLLHQWTALIDNPNVSSQTKFKLFRMAVAAKVEGAGVAVILHISGGTRGPKIIDRRSLHLLFQIARSPNAAEAATLLRLVTDASEINLPWCFQLLRVLARRTIFHGQCGVWLSALAPFQVRKTNPSNALVRQVFKRLVSVSDLGFFEHGHQWEAIKKLFPMEVYDLLRERITYSRKAEDNYTAIPHELDAHVTLPAMATQKGIGRIVRELWAKATNRKREDIWCWHKLFHAVILTDERFWKRRLIKSLHAAISIEDLCRLRQLISFEGSLIIFGFPEITELFLKKAQELGGKRGMEEIRTELWVGAGPKARGFTNGKLDPEYDYIAPAALKAAADHVGNPILGPFFSWIVKQEQTAAVHNLLRSQEE